MAQMLDREILRTISNLRFAYLEQLIQYKIVIKKKYVYRGYGIKFDSAGSCSFGNKFGGNVITFGVDNSSSSHADNRKNNTLVRGEGPTNGINGSFESPEKNFALILLK